MTIADRIRGKMAEQRIKVTDMTRLFKVTPRTWSGWMRNPEKIPVGRLQVIAARLGTSTANLIGEED